MRHTRIVVTHYGGPEALRVVEEECPEPKSGEVRVRVLAAGVSMPDIMAREGVHPETPRVPYTPGWDLVGEVERLGKGVSGVDAGQIVAAMPIHGAYAEFVCLPQSELVPVPSGLDAAKAVSLILNYVTAYQMLHRSARVKPGQRVLFHGASGGVGTALLQLGRLADLEMYGTCSSRGAPAVSELGGIPIDYQHQDVVEEIRRLTGEGVDAVFDPIGGPHLWHSREALRPGGRVVGYGNTTALRGEGLGSTRSGRRNRLHGIPNYIMYIAGGWLLPGGRRIVPYSIQTLKRLRPALFRQDVTALFDLLQQEKIQPLIAQRFPLAEARRAQELLAKGGVIGKIVLVTKAAPLGAPRPTVAGAATQTGPLATVAASSGDLCFMSARDLVALLRGRKVSAREVMSAHLERIGRVNPSINAIVAKLDDRQCLALADAADARAAKGERLGPLHGLPIAFKDLQPAVGFPWTRGSTIYKDAMPTEDSVLVERLRHAGALPIGKTNTPEFGMGSHTYNRVYGTTVNPFDHSKSAGGSSGGAGAALATGMLPIADGSDMGGSLRNPGNFNNIVGLRPTVGLVPTAPSPLPFLDFAVNGPMARTVADVAFLLSVMAGPDPRDPACVPSDSSVFLAELNRSFEGTRVAWCPDLGGLPLDPRIRAVLVAQRKTFEALGCVVEDACPDFSDADSVFLTVRAFRSATMYGPLLADYREQLKPEAVAEIEAGLALTSADLARAMIAHGQLLERMHRFQEQYEFVLCAVNQVPPFDATLDWPKTIDGVKMEHYVAWMKSAYWISATFRPAISVPAGFTTDGLPVGLQIVGRHRADFGLLQVAHAFEQATGFGSRRPALE